MKNNETKRQQEERDVNVLMKNLRKEHDKEILIHGIFMGVMIGSLLTGIMKTQVLNLPPIP